MSEFKVGDLVEWSWNGVPQFLGIIVLVGERITPDGYKLNGIHYLRLISLDKSQTGIGKIGWTRQSEIAKHNAMGKLRIVSDNG